MAVAFSADSAALVGPRSDLGPALEAIEPDMQLHLYGRFIFRGDTRPEPARPETLSSDWAGSRAVLRRCSAKVCPSGDSGSDRGFLQPAPAICASPLVPADARNEFGDTVSLRGLQRCVGTKSGTGEWL